MLIECIEAIRDLHGQVTDVHRGRVMGTGGGSDGAPNWTVPVLTDRGAQIIRTLQGQFDLDE